MAWSNQLEMYFCPLGIKSFDQARLLFNTFRVEPCYSSDIYFDLHDYFQIIGTAR